MRALGEELAALTAALWMDDVETIERCAYAAWPAEEVKDLDGWRLRAMRWCVASCELGLDERLRAPRIRAAPGEAPGERPPRVCPRR